MKNSSKKGMPAMKMTKIVATKINKPKTIESKKVSQIDIKKERIERLRNKDLAMGLSGTNTEMYERKSSKKLPTPQRIPKNINIEPKSKPTLKEKIVKKVSPKLWKAKYNS